MLLDKAKDIKVPPELVNPWIIPTIESIDILKKFTLNLILSLKRTSKIEKIIEMSEELQVDRIIVFGFKVTENVNEKNIEIISKKIIPIYEKILNLFVKFLSESKYKLAVNSLALISSIILLVNI